MTPSRVFPATRLLLDTRAFCQATMLSRSTVERLVQRGLPAIDVSTPRPGRRRKRILRFELEAAMAWLRARPDLIPAAGSGPRPHVPLRQGQC